MAFCVVTGVAGFIGSHVAEGLIAGGHEVLGIDCFTDYYCRSIKQSNIHGLLSKDEFRFLEIDLANGGAERFAAADYVFHLAAQPGVRASWGGAFDAYVRNNVIATQRVLEAVRGRRTPLVVASSSSVYGEAETLPVREDQACHPISPYGVTKLAGESLCLAYARAYGIPTTILRFFTVYGPRQRPDMAFHSFMKKILDGETIPIYGSGAESRDYTYIDDAVQACLACLKRPPTSAVLNISGGSRTSMSECVRQLRAITGREVKVELVGRRGGDPSDTHADTNKAREELGYRPATPLTEGLRREWEWIRSLYGSNERP